MSLDEAMSPRAAHHREIADETRRTHHTPSSRRDEWVDYETLWERYQEMEHAEQAAEAMYQEGLANLRREQPFRFAPSDPEPTVDRRCFGRGELDNPQSDPEPFRWSA